MVCDKAIHAIAWHISSNYSRPSIRKGGSSSKLPYLKISNATIFAFRPLSGILDLLVLKNNRKDCASRTDHERNPNEAGDSVGFAGYLDIYK